MASHMSPLSFGRARSCANVEPAKKRSRSGGRSSKYALTGLSPTKHVHVPDVILGVRLGHSPEAVTFVESLEIHLRGDPDFAAPPRFLHPPDGLLHQRAPRARSPHVGMSDHASDGRLRVLRAWRQKARVCNEAPAPIDHLPAEQVLSDAIDSVRVE